MIYSHESKACMHVTCTTFSSLLSNSARSQ
uniref:Uncharacterized protein n=1 Tax=Arundo donax TaxID=35708 RepID=A0A0A9H694_ARUDO